MSGPEGSDTLQQDIAVGDGYGAKAYGSGPYGDPNLSIARQLERERRTVDDFAPVR